MRHFIVENKQRFYLLDFLDLKAKNVMPAFNFD